MRFTFWVEGVEGLRALDTDNLFEAARIARDLGLKRVLGYNPGTRREFAYPV
ncbi:MAG: hypothetical protein L6Q68_15130 [Aquabacterium sp.]|jgi:hypothetical protein|nr:hypothetical protein [Aquabacterium sp.]